MEDLKKWRNGPTATTPLSTYGIIWPLDPRSPRHLDRCSEICNDIIWIHTLLWYFINMTSDDVKISSRENPKCLTLSKQGKTPLLPKVSHRLGHSNHLKGVLMWLKPLFQTLDHLWPRVTICHTSIGEEDAFQSGTDKGEVDTQGKNICSCNLNKRSLAPHSWTPHPKIITNSSSPVKVLSIGQMHH